MNDTISAAPSEADLEKFCDAYDWDGWTDQKAAQRAFARAALAKWGKPTPQAVVEPLTDEQIVGVMHSIPINAAPSHHIAFARAIEHAHGIGIKKENGNG